MPRVNPVAARLTVLALAFGALAGCAAQPRTEVIAAPLEPGVGKLTEADVATFSDLNYGGADGIPLLLDACLPPESADGSSRAAVLIIHGGSWARGTKADEGYARICRMLAAAGFAAFSMDYRLAPAHVFPAAIDDVETAVRWLRAPEQVEAFDLDPTRIAAYGGSAGGNLAALLGTRGEGDLTTGSRVAAVVDLSGPIDLSGIAATADFVPVQLAYLGCATDADCPAALEASPLSHIDPTDPPFFVAHSTSELIPLEQSAIFVGALRAADVSVEFVTVDGTLHSIAMLDDELDQRILDFLTAALAPPGGGAA